MSRSLRHTLAIERVEGATLADALDHTTLAHLSGRLVDASATEPGGIVEPSDDIDNTIDSVGQAVLKTNTSDKFGAIQPRRRWL